MAIITPHAPTTPAGGPPAGGEQPTGGGPPAHGRHPRRWVAGVLAAVGAAALAAGLLVATGGSGPETTPTTVPSTTVPPTTTPTTVPVPASRLATAVYPIPTSGIRFAHPVAAARTFATDYVGFVDPVVSRFFSSGTESGTAEVRAATDTVATTVRLERITGSWWVFGSSTPDIRLDVPSAAAAVSSPVRVQGVSTAFEAQVNVEVRQDGARTPIGTGYVMGGSMGELGPFDGSIPFTTPSAARGALVLSTTSMKDGHLFEATVVRIAFAPSTPLVPATACPQYSMTFPTAPAGEMVTTVFYSCGVDGAPVPTYRLVPTTRAVLRSALDQLLAGPTAPERTAGLTSWFSASTAGYVQGVTVSSGAATVDFADLRSVIPNASTSAGARLLLSQLDATVFQFPGVTSVLYRIDGSCQTFGEWLQIDGCVARSAPTTAP